MSLSVDARELQIYLENDGEIYRRRVIPIAKNLLRKMRKGTFDAKKSVKAWMYAVDDASKKYRKEFGPSAEGRGNHFFPIATRRDVALQIAKEFVADVKAGEWDWLKKKL